MVLGRPLVNSKTWQESMHTEALRQCNGEKGQKICLFAGLLAGKKGRGDCNLLGVSTLWRVQWTFVAKLEE